MKGRLFVERFDLNFEAAIRGLPHDWGFDKILVDQRRKEARTRLPEQSGHGKDIAWESF